MSEHLKAWEQHTLKYIKLHPQMYKINRCAAMGVTLLTAKKRRTNEQR